MRQIMRSNRFQVTFNQSFDEVIRVKQVIVKVNERERIQMKCSKHISIFTRKVGKSVEVWEDKELVGGLYGVEVGSVFCGESMFSKVSNTSKLALIALVQNNKTYQLIDCQVYNDHLASLGAQEIPRARFLDHLRQGH